MTYHELKHKVLRLSKEYYDESKPSVSDAEWDALYAKLEAVEKAQGWRDADSPTLRVGGAAGKVKHPYKLYSLQKVYDKSEIKPDFDHITPKIDGTNLTLIYKRGKLKLALTRGNGEMGEDVTHLAKYIQHVPNNINLNDDWVVNGECVTTNCVDNFRNYVSGALGLKSAEEFSERNIAFIAHDLLSIRDLNYDIKLNILASANFKTVSRVTLHNIDIIEEHNLGLGDTIKIERAGGVIPKFIEVVKHSKHERINEQHAAKAIGLAVVRNGPRLFVKDKSSASSVKFLEYFIRTMEIKGLGPKSIEKMELTHPVDLYETQAWDTLGVNGEKIIDEIERSKTKPYITVLAALGIEGVGRGGAKLIVPHIPTFARLREIEYKEIKGIGPRTIENILTWLDENEDWVKNLPLQLEQDVTVEETLGNEKKICITGKADMTRNELASHLSQFGFKNTSTVTKDCYALISAGDTSSSKYTRAVKLGIKIIDYWDNKSNIMNGVF
jgi:NAD-dependent DNA ligase